MANRLRTSNVRSIDLAFQREFQPDAIASVHRVAEETALERFQQQEAVKRLGSKG